MFRNRFLACLLPVSGVALIVLMTIGARSVEGDPKPPRKHVAQGILAAVEDEQDALAVGLVRVLEEDKERKAFDSRRKLPRVRVLAQRGLMEEGDEPVPVTVPFVKLPDRFDGNAYRLNYVKATTNGKSVKFFTTSPGLDVHPETLSDGLTVMLTGEPGDHVLCAYTALGDVPSDVSKCIVTLKGPQPPPGPSPQPNPQPAPVPTPTPGPTPQPPVPPEPTNLTATKLHIVVVSNAVANDAKIRAMVDDQLWERQAVAKGHSWKHFDRTNKVTDQYVEQEKLAGGLPFVVIFDALGDARQPQYTWLNKNAIDVRLPATEESLARLIAKYTRK